MYQFKTIVFAVSSFEILLNSSLIISAKERGWVSCTVIDKPAGNYLTQLIRGEAEDDLILSECIVPPRFLHLYELQDDCDPTEQFFNLTIKSASCIDDTPLDLSIFQWRCIQEYNTI